MKKIKRFVYLVLIGCTSATAQDDHGNFFIRNYAPKEYRAGIQNWSIVQDKRGVMYFGNGDCVLAYDGVSWRKIRTDKGTIVRSLTIDEQGTIYVGGVGEFGYLAPDSSGSMRFVALTDKVPEAYRAFADVWKCFAGKKGVYFQTFDVLFLFTDGKIKAWKPRTSFHQSFLVKDELYITQRQVGLMHMASDSLQLMPEGETFAQVRIYAILPYDSNRILIGTREKGLYLYSNENFQSSGRIAHFRTQADSFLLENQLYHGIELGSGEYVLTTLRGGVIFIDKDGNIKHILDKSSGLQDNNVFTALCDRQGGLWLGLNNGIARAEIMSPFSIYAESSDLAGAVLSVTRHEGTLYVGTFRGLYFLNKKNNSGIKQFKSVPGIATQCYFLLSAGPSLLASTQDGVYSFRDSKTALIQKQASALFLFRSKLDTMRICVGLRNGLAYLYWKDGQWKDGGRIEEINEEIRTITEEQNGQLWIGTLYQGLLRVTPPWSLANKKGGWIIEKFGTQQGLPAGSVYAYSVAGRQVFGTANGFYRFDKEKNILVPDSVFGHALTNTARSVSRLAEGDDAKVWMNLSGDHPETMVAYPQNDGTYSIETASFLRISDFTVMALYPEKNGAVWLGGPNGLLHYNSKIDKNYREEYQTLIRRISIGRDSVIYGGNHSHQKSSGAPVIDYLNNSLRFEFSAASYDNESSNLYQYWLEGFDPSWSDWTPEVIKDYTNIPEGFYTFHIRAKNIYAQIGKEDAYDFAVSAPWYRTLWSFGIYGLLFVLTLYSSVKWRARSLEKEKERLERIVEDRTIEVVKQKEKLEQRTTELETINVIVSSINSEVIFTDLLKSILNETSVIHGVEKASALVFDRSRNVFCFKASRGWDMKDLEPIELTLQESDERYVKNSLEIFEDVYVIKDVKGRRGEEKMEHLGIPKSMLVTRIRIEGRVEGYFIYDNMHYDNAFEDQDILLLKNLKEHITSAFIKSRMLEDLQLKNSQITRASELKSKFMADMSHELRTPMNAILGFSDLLKQKLLGEINPGQEDALQAISESGKNLLQLINDILDLSKIEAGKMVLHPRIVYLEEVVLSVRNVIISLLQKKKQQFSIAIDPSISLCVDETKFKQVLFNLLSNANKFTPEGGKIGIEAKVIAGTAEEAEEIDIRVSDTGKGIPPSELLSVFEEFRQVEGDTEQGTGLGLTLCKKFIELHHGRIFAESDGANGSVFLIRIPSKPPGDPVSEQVIRSPMQGQISILIIEDDPSAVKILKYYMEKEGYSTMVAFNGKDGIRMAQKDKPSVVTLDVMLPDKNGWEVLKELKSKPETEHLPVIMISAVEENEQGLQLKANDYFVKPVDRKELIKAIEKVSGKDNPLTLVNREEFIEEIKSVVK